MIENDLFGITDIINNKNNKNKNKVNIELSNILDNLLNNMGLKVKQYTIRLINTFANESIGRS